VNLFKRLHFRLSPASIALIYAAVGAAWIVVSGALLSFSVADAALQKHLELAKGLAYVVITSGLLYLLLWRWQRRRLAEQKQLQEEATRSLSHFFEQPFVGMTLTSPSTGGWLKFNDRMCAMLGYLPAEFAEKTWRDLIHPDDIAAAESRVERLVRGEVDSLSGEARYLRKDGSALFAQVNLNCVRSSTGAVEFFVVTVLDISHLKQVEEKTAIQSGMLEEMAEIAQVGGWSLDLRNMALYWTKEVYRIHELDPESQPILHDTLMFYTPEAQPIIQYAMQQAIEEGIPFDLELPFITAKGRRIWVRAQAKPLVENGKAVLLRGAFQDITARKEKEDELRLIRLQQDTMLRNAVVGIAIVRSRKVVSCNRRMEEIFGYDEGEMNNQSTRHIFQSQEDYEKFGKAAYASLAKNNSYWEETNLLRKDGSLIRGVFSGNAIDPANPHEGSVWCYLDVSEAHASRQKAQRLLMAAEQSPVSIVITDPAAKIEYANQAFLDITGYTREEIIGQNPRILKSGETPAETYQEMWKALMSGKNWQGVLRNRRKNGELYWENASISPVYDETGKITRYLAVKEDDTERKNFIEQLERYRLHLEETVQERTAQLSEALEAALLADHAKDEFLANVSHELRTPLNVVIGLSDLARRISDDPKLNDYLDKITGAGKNLAGIINDLLDLSKIVAGHLEFENVTFNPRQVLEHCRAAIALHAESKGLELILDADESVPDVLIGDPMRVEQIMLNLLNNAVKFTASGHIKARMSMVARESDRVCLGIEVEDTGIGISPADAEKLFKPFSQADNSITRRFGGTGLGLAICKRLAEMMDGSIATRPRPGGGSIFNVRLWLQTGNVEAVMADKPDQQTEAEALHFRDVRILAVDDQPGNLEIVEALLRAVGITPTMAKDGQEAIGLLKAEGRSAFDLVLMDIQMPVMDGLTATQQIRQWAQFTDLPIIALTAHTMEHEKRRSLDAGFNDHIGKPFDNDKFYNILAKWIPRIKQQPLVASGNLSGSGFPAIAGIDTRAGLSRLAGNVERYRHWLLTFTTEAPQMLSQISEHLIRGDSDGARKLAHALRGRAGMLGANSAQLAATTLEDALYKGMPAAEPLARTQEVIHGICQAINDTIEAEAK